MKKPDLPDDVLAYFRAQGSKGGKTRAKKYTKEQQREMGKKGGRPKGKKRPKKAAAKGTK